MAIPWQIFAEQTTIEQLLNTAQSQFEQHDYTAAIQNYQLASSLQPDNLDIYFNLGVCYYKTKQYAAAKEMFLKTIASEPHASISFLNLGLIALQENNKQQAKTWLARVLQLPQQNEATDLASLLIKRIEDEEKTENGRQRLSFWMLSFTSGLESNSLLPTLTGEINSGNNNTFLDMFFYGSYALHPSVENGMNISANAYLLKNSEAPSSDLYFMSTGIDKSFTKTKLRHTLAAEVMRLYLANSPMEMEYKLTYKLKYQASSPWVPILTLNSGYIAPLDDNYSAYRGYQYAAKLDFSRYTGIALWKLDFGYEKNNRKDYQNGTTFRSSSPEYYKVRIRNSTPLVKKISLKPSLEYRYAEFRTAASTTQRQDRQFKISTKFDYQWNKDTDLGAQVDFQQNKSSYEIYEYNKKTLSLYLDVVF